MEIPYVAERQLGLITRQQALSAGWTRRQVERAVRTGQLVPVGPGVLRVAGAATAAAAQDRAVREHAQLVAAAQLGRDHGWFAARRSTVVLVGLPLLGRPPIVAQLLRDQSPLTSRARDRHSRVAPLPADEQVLAAGVASVSPARAIVDLARAESPRSALVVADAALRRGLDAGELQRVLDRQRRWPGVVRARQVLARADGRAESPLESPTRWGCEVEQLLPVEPQVELRRWGELVARLDLVLLRELLVLEPDGAVKFDGPGVLPALLERQERIRECGLDVVRVGWGDVIGDTRRFGDRVRARLAQGSTRRLARGVQLVTTQTRPSGLVLPSYQGWPLAS